MTQELTRELTLAEKCVDFKTILDIERGHMEEAEIEGDIVYPLDLIESFFTFNSEAFVGVLPRELRIALAKIGVFARKVRGKDAVRFGGEELKSKRWKSL